MPGLSAVRSVTLVLLTCHSVRLWVTEAKHFLLWFGQTHVHIQPGTEVVGCVHSALAQLGVGEQRINSLEAQLGSYQTIEVIRCEAQVPVSATSLQVLLTSLHYMCDCRPFKWKIIFGSKVPSCSLHHRQFNFYVLRRTFSFSAGVTNGIQKAFNGLPPALKAAPRSTELCSNWLELPLRWRLQVELGFTFVWHLPTQGLKFDNFT